MPSPFNHRFRSDSHVITASETGRHDALWYDCDDSKPPLFGNTVQFRKYTKQCREIVGMTLLTTTAALHIGCHLPFFFGTETVPDTILRIIRVLYLEGTLAHRSL